MPDDATTNPFLEKLKERPPADTRRDEVMAILAEFCEAIVQYTDERLACEALPGFLTNLGQEYRITAVPQAGRVPETVLLRAHVPGTGYPVRLDLYDENLVTCSDADSLRRGLTGFLDDERVRNNIDALSAAAK